MKIGIKEDSLITAKLPKIYLLSDTASIANALQAFAREKCVIVNIEDYILDILDFCIGYFDTAINITNVVIPDNTKQKIKKALFFQMVFEAMYFMFHIKELNEDLAVDCKVLEGDIAITIRASLRRKLITDKHSNFIDNLALIAKENNYEVSIEINRRAFFLKLLPINHYQNSLQMLN